MKTYRLVSEVTVSAYTTVRANNLEEAIEIGSERNVEIGGELSDALENEVWVIGDADGSPMNIHAE